MQRRTYLKSVGGTAIGVSVAGCLGSSGSSGGSGEEIIAGTAPGFPPFEMKQGGELVGFDIDMLEAVVEETNYSLSNWKTFEFSSLIPALTSGKIDVIAAALTITDEREKTIDYTVQYYNADQAVIVRKNGDFSPNALSDLSGHPIGAQSGTTGEGVVKSELIKTGKLKQSNYNSYGNYVLAVEDLINGNIDAVVLDTPVAQTFTSNRPVKIAFTVQTNEFYGFGLRNDANALVGGLNDGIEVVKRNGTYEKLINEWFGSQ